MASAAGGSGSGSSRSAGGAPPAAPPAAAPGRALHPRSFKLRFAAQREPGRSYVSPVKPLGLPATVTGKFYSREEPAAGDSAHANAADRIRDMFARGPRDKYASPATSAQEYGWHAAASAPPPADRRLQHHIRDSAWLKERLRVLAADDKLKQR